MDPKLPIRSLDYTVIFARQMPAMRGFYGVVLGFPLHRELSASWRFRQRYRFVHFLVLLLLQASAGAAISAEPHSLVLARTGDLPILLTAPHGGRESVPNVPLRSRGITSTDGHTLELAEGLSRHLANSLGGQPYLVAARFGRRHIDANRAPADAFESPHAKRAYDAYHGQIRQFIAQIRERFPQGAVLLDIHGQSEDPLVVHRGTRNGATVTALIRKRGTVSLNGPSSIFGVVHSKGYKVFPTSTPIGNPPEDRRYDGGYTVQTYGSRTPAGLDAIQIEVGRDLRRDARFIAALGEGVTVFYRTYLKDSSPPRTK